MTAQDPYRYFRIEAHELLEQLGKDAMDLERGTTAELVARMLRAAHTLKGAARVVKQRDIADEAHLVEDALAPHRESTARVPRAAIEALLGLVDSMGIRVAALTLLAPVSSNGAPRDVAATASLPAAASATVAPPADAARTVRAEISEMDELLEGIAETHAYLAPLRKRVADIGRARHLIGGVAGHATTGGNGAPPGHADRDLEELTDLLEGIERGVVLDIEHIDRELSQVRDSAERLRLVPAGSLFTALERTARDAALMQSKQVVFEGRGAEVRLDAHVLDVMQGALVQMVRNAVAHGIEPGHTRTARGKPPQGRITLEIGRRGRDVIFSCADDGQGVDLAAVRLALESKGRLSGDIRDLGSEELLRLLVKGGITTSSRVTEVSGRGVGLDVVREAAERLRGEVTVRTESGQGTRVEVVVPLSLAAVHGLVVEASGVVATIPLQAIRKTLRVVQNDIARTSTGESIVHAGTVIPFIPLGKILSARHASGWGGGARSAVIVEDDRGDTAAFAVDRLLGTATVLLRPLPELAPAASIVAGVALDAEGNPQLVLDPIALVAEAARFLVPASTPAARPHPILVIDDSLTTRMLEQSILESSGYDVEVACSGEEALEKAARTDYALFLVDVEMPGIDGFTFIERTRKDPALRSVPAILVSSRAAPEDRLRGQQVGASGYVVKSEFDQGALLGHIRSLVG